MGDAGTTIPEYDLVVIGAGWYGLGAAKAYIELHPQHKVRILEYGNYCGGTWSKDRLYPGLKSNNLWSSYEFPDFPMTTEEYGVKEGDHIPAATLHRYLTDFAKHFGIFENTQFGTKVDTIEATPSDEWILHVTTNQSQSSIKASKVIVATGLTSTPNLPEYPGLDTFKPPFFHAKDFCKRSDLMGKIKHVTVVGGGKSAMDVAYIFAAEGDATVDLVIRPTGQGPVWLCPPYVTPLKRKLEELLHTRFFSWMSPCPWQKDSGYWGIHSWLQQSSIGLAIVEKFWNTISNEVIDTHGYKKDKEVGKLQPLQSAKWTGSSVGIHNFPTNLYDLVKQGQIRVHVADIERLDDDKVCLSDGQTLKTDVVICATGWKKASDLKFEKFNVRLPISDDEIERRSKEADDKVLKMFPTLTPQPELNSTPGPADPLRNYRFMVPAAAVPKRNLAFAGMMSTVSTSIAATIQGLWISAYFDGKLDREAKTQDEVVDEIMFNTQFEKWRYPCGYGAVLPDFAFDCIQYIDLLMKDLGLQNQRKPTYLKEWFAPYKPRDYKGASHEWLESHK